MALQRKSEQTASNNSTIEYTNLEAGEHEGRLVYVADLGLQRREWKGEEKPATQQISLGIEIVGQSVTVDGEELPRLLWTSPFNIFQTMSDQGKELPMYKTFVPSAKEGEVADWEGVLGMPCSVLVTHTKGKGDYADRVFDNISALLPIPAKYQSGVTENKIEPAIGDSEDEENEATKALYGLARWVWGNRVQGVPQQVEQKKVVVEPTADVNLDDDIPF